MHLPFQAISGIVFYYHLFIMLLGMVYGIGFGSSVTNRQWIPGCGDLLDRAAVRPEAAHLMMDQTCWGQSLGSHTLEQHIQYLFGGIPVPLKKI